MPKKKAAPAQGSRSDLPKITVRCSQCRCEGKGKQLPSGVILNPRNWVKYQTQVLCEKCKKLMLLPRVLSVRLARPLAIKPIKTNEWELLDWPGYMQRLLPQLEYVTLAANRACLFYYVNDVQLVPKAPHVPDYPNVDSIVVECYRHICKCVPELASGTAAAIARDVWSFYKRHRINIHWKGTQVPRFRYPYPLPIRASELKLEEQDIPDPKTEKVRRRLVVQFQLGKEVVRVLVRRGRGHDRNIAILKNAVDTGDPDFPTTVKLTGAKMSIKPCSWSMHRYVMREPNSKNRVYLEPVLMIGVQMPKPASEPGSELMVLKTDADSFLLYAIGKGRNWFLNADEFRRMGLRADSSLDPDVIRRELAAHDYRMDRIAEDMKFLFRRSRRRGPHDVRGRMSDKQNRRMLNFIAYEVRRLVECAQVRKVGIVHYNDDCRDYFEHFPWYAFKAALNTAFSAVNIQFVDKSTVKHKEDERAEDDDEQYKPSKRRAAKENGATRPEEVEAVG